MAKISVIIPLYNKAKFIRRAIDSVLAQTFQDFEVIVVDDGSIDDGPEIVRSYNDSRIKLVSQVNAGPGPARNRGVKESNTELLSFLDADDEWLPEFLQVSIKTLQNHPECSVSVTSWYKGDTKRDLTDKFKKEGLNTGVWFLQKGSGLTIFSQVHALFFTSVVVCTKHIFNKLGGFYDNVRVVCGEDTYLWLQMVLNCKIFITLQPLAWYHSEASELGHRWEDGGVVQPYYFDNGRIWHNCPEIHQYILEEFLISRAFTRATELCEKQDIESAYEICRAFPLMKRFLWRYFKLRIKMICPRLYFIYRRVVSS